MATTIYHLCLTCLAVSKDHRNERAGLCADCSLELEHLSAGYQVMLPREQAQQTLPMFVCGRYQGLLRQLILRAKAGGDLRALRFLVAMMLDHPMTRQTFTNADAVVCAPSSLWSRIQGKYDLAYAVAAAGAKQFQLSWVQLPWSYYWRWRKQAHRGRDRKIINFRPLKDSARLSQQLCRTTGAGCKLVIVDDIVTSGFTMASLAARLTDFDVRGLALAAAPRLLDIASGDQDKRE